MKLNLYSKSIILIGPSGVGKTTVAEELSRITRMQKVSLDEIANKARKNGYGNRFDNADEFNYNIILNILNKAKEKDLYGIIDFGAGHSVYQDKTIFEKIKLLLKPFENIVLLLPCKDNSRALEIMKERSTGDTTDNKRFIESSCNKELATEVIYGDNKSPQKIAEEILSKFQEKNDLINTI